MKTMPAKKTPSNTRNAMTAAAEAVGSVLGKLAHAVGFPPPAKAPRKRRGAKPAKAISALSQVAKKAARVKPARRVPAKKTRSGNAAARIP
jgi:hypothetical protein